MGKTPMPLAADIVKQWIIAEPGGTFHPRAVIHGIDTALPLRKIKPCGKARNRLRG